MWPQPQKNYIVPEKAQKEGKNMEKNKIFEHNMNEETVKNMQKVLDYLFLEAFESDRLITCLLYTSGENM